MASYDAGTSVGRYLLEADQALKTQQQLIKNYQQLAKAASIKPPPIPAPPAIPKPPTGGGVSPAAQVAAQAAAERAILARAAAEARLIQIQNTGRNTLAGLVKAEQIYADALAKVDKNSVAAIRTAAQLQTVQNRIAGQKGGGLAALPRTLDSFGTDAIDQFKSGLLGVVGPAAVAGIAITTLTGQVQSFRDAFKLKADLDATTLAIRTNLEGARDSGKVFNEAAQFAARYRLTQQQTAEILSNSTDILRTSTASVTALETALLRLQSRDVSKPVSEAARALRELNTGDVTSIKDLFNVPAQEALRMKNEIAAGADAVQVLNAYLDRAGVSMTVLENRSKGAAGAMNEQAIAQEKLALAKAKFAEGPGVAFTDFGTNALKEFTAILSGDFSEIEARNAARVKGQEAYNAAIKQGKTDAQALAIAQQVMAAAERDAAVASAQAASALTTDAYDRHADAIRVVVDMEARRVAAATAATTANRDAAQSIHDQTNANIASARQSVIDTALKEQQQQRIARLAVETRAAANAFLALNPGMTASGAIAAAAAQGYSLEVGQLAQIMLGADNAAAALGRLNAQQAGIASLQKGLAAGLGSQPSALARGVGGGAGASVAAFTRDQAAAERLLDSQIALAAAQGNRAKQIALLQEKERLYAGDQAERNQIEAQIIGLRDRGDTAHSKALKDQLSTQESIYDSLQKQRSAQLSLFEAIIKDRQQDRRDAADLAKAQRVQNDPRKSAAFKAAAADAAALLNIQDQQRELDIAKLQATAGGTIGPGGKLFQSIPGGGVVPVSAPPGPIPIPQQTATTRAGTLATGAPIDVSVKVYVDGQELVARVVTELEGGLSRSQAAGGGG